MFKHMIKFIITGLLVLLNTTFSLIAFYIAFHGVNNNHSFRSWEIGFSVLNHFSIGLFIGLSIVGLYSSSAVKLRLVQENFLKNNIIFLQHYPISETIFCLGIFFLFTLEWFFQKAVNKVYRFDVQKYPLKSSILHYDENYLTDTEDEIELLLLVQSNNSTMNSMNSSNNKMSKRSFSHRNLDVKHQRQQQHHQFGKSILLSFALSLHSFFEGISFGLLDSFDQVIGMTIGMTMHQCICAVTLGFRLAQSSITHTKRCIAIFILLTYLLVFPTGVFSGKWFYDIFTNSNITSHNLTAAASSPPPVQPNHSSISHEFSLSGYIFVGLIQNFAASCFVYVILFDMLLPTVYSIGIKMSPTNHCMHSVVRTSSMGILCFCSLFLGFIFFCSLRILHHR
ncbi:unnamed protein product [Schistosoma turkestanicum]|nr:unnamed protein product [Schistosoma turkestanicum]